MNARRTGSCLLLSLGVCAACKSRLVVGSWASVTDASRPALSVPGDAGATEAAPSWQTGFEDGPADYEQGGECFASPSSSYEFVNSPVHSGQSAIAFQVAADGTEDGFMAHCVRYGELPDAAFYGAWFFVPTEVTSAYVWALMHFDSNGAVEQRELWDVALELDSTGSLQAYVRDYLRSSILRPETGGEVPVGTWFHLEVYLKRAADATGSVALYLDGTELLRATDLITDDGETSEWYVGNFAALTSPRPNTVYVDDVTISPKRQVGSP